MEDDFMEDMGDEIEMAKAQTPSKNTANEKAMKPNEYEAEGGDAGVDDQMA